MDQNDTLESNSNSSEDDTSADGSDLEKDKIVSFSLTCKHVL